MQITSTPGNLKASLLLRCLHWFMALILVAAWALIYAKGIFEKGSDTREFLKYMHVLAGLAIFTLLPLRMIVRWLSPLPEIIPSPGRRKILFMKIIHTAFYLCMIFLPILGVFFMQLGGKTIDVAGFEFPAIIQADKELSRGIKEIHESLGLIMLYLAVIHAGIALWHHFFLRDNTLELMLPNRDTVAEKNASSNTSARNRL